MSGLTRCLLSSLLMFAALPASASESGTTPPSKIALAIHAGAGTLLPSDMTPEREAAYRAELGKALDAGYAVLKAGGTSLDAVEASVLVMEESPLFNAGKGAVFTHDGRHELDAAIMNGADRRAGAIAGSTRIRNPIRAARAVMEKSVHVMLTGPGADAFAGSVGLELVDNHWFDTEFRWNQLLKERGDDPATPMPSAAPDNKATNASAGGIDAPLDEKKFGTVGAVALDVRGHLAAATSTGGMTNKKWGRVGDAPLIGAGTYATDHCAVSATGHGEYFIRVGVAHEICARMKFRGETPVDAANAVVMDTLKAMGGEGGVIVIDANGNIAQPFNSAGMYRGAIDVDGNRTIAIFGGAVEAARATVPAH